MRQVKTEKLSVAEANRLLKIDMEPAFFEALVRMVAYPDLRYDPATRTISFPSYVPFAQLAADFLEGIDQGLTDLRRCLHCNGYFEVGTDAGIFARPSEMEGFVCARCAESITAREFYEKYMQ